MLPGQMMVEKQKKHRQLSEYCYFAICENRHLQIQEIFLDWGLGDHWRFKNYKVGWFKDGEHEWFYNKTSNDLYIRLFNDDEPTLDNIRLKTQSYAIDISHQTKTLDNVSIENLNFFNLYSMKKLSMSSSASSALISGRPFAYFDL